ncbi:hypothetical protein [Photorhabdus asymbiotica]|uniref:hypothetical protein n=1 Tax=Photorhabdus asymbiotica TaxID=291112 RepID=UPI003DA77DCE
MEKKYNWSTSESNTESTKPSKNELEDSLKEDSTPIPIDYADLIDITNMDRHEIDKTLDQTDNPNSALKPGDDYTQVIKINPDGGLKVGNDGLSLKIKAGNGIKVDNSGISIDLNNALPKGMIVMFSGANAPTGWAFCDGNNGTPDLRSRFVMCGETISETGKSNSKTSGSGNVKYFYKNTTSTTVSVNVTVENTILTESQIPSHYHIGGMATWDHEAAKYSYYNPGGKYTYTNLGYQKANFHAVYAYTSSTGGGKGHNHPATASSPAHNHSVDIIPPYYLLAFIMKL